MSVARLQSANRDDIDGTTQKRRELILEMEKIEQRTADFEVHQEIDVARRRVVSSATEPKSAADRPRCCRTSAWISSRLASTIARRSPMARSYRHALGRHGPRASEMHRAGSKAVPRRTRPDSDSGGSDHRTGRYVHRERQNPFTST